MFHRGTFRHAWSLLAIVYAVLGVMLSPFLAIATEWQAISRGLLPDGSEQGFVQFLKDDIVFYTQRGGPGGGTGRGFNIAAIHPATGLLRHPVQVFNTWSTQAGAAMTAMVTFLDGLPNGTVVLIAVCEVVSTNEAVVQALENLGSTQIRDSGEVDSWAMIAVKGAGQARGEQLAHRGVEAAVQTTLAPFSPPTPRDLNGDGTADLVWRNTLTGDVAGWLMNGLTLQQGAIIEWGVSLEWQIVGVGDLKGDGKADLVWHNTQTGDVAGWLMNGLTLQQGAIIAPAIDLHWNIVGVGDLNGDGQADLVWHNTQTGDVAGWLMNGLTLQQGAIIAPAIDLHWNIVGVGDLNGDGKADLVWRNPQTWEVAVWLMNGLTLQHGAIMSAGIAPPGLEIAGVGDLNGDGKADLVWRNLQTGNFSGWLMNGVSFQRIAIIAPAIDLHWNIVEVGDLNGDGKADLVWRNDLTGNFSGWLMNGLTLQEGAIIAWGIDLEWHIQ